MSVASAGIAPSMKYEQVIARFPWLDYGTFAIPDAWADVILWARYFWMQNGDYRQSMKMVASYFVTGLDFKDIADEEREDYKDFFNSSVNYSRECVALGMDFNAYGEVIRTMFFPTHRSLRCTDCGFEQPIKQAEYEWSNYDFVRKTPCPVCGQRAGAHLDRIDRKDTDMSKVRINRWDPSLIQVAWSAVSQKSAYWLRIPATLKKQINEGVEVVICDIPWEFVECVQQGRDLELDPDMVFHEYHRDITGVMENGRGLSPAVGNFRLFWLIQTLNRQDQAIAIDYITGLRLYSPTPQNSVSTGGPTSLGADPMLNRGGRDFVGSMSAIINQHRADPTKRFTAPHPVTYQFTGGEGKNLSPYDMIAQRKEELLHASGVPVEFYKLNLQGQGAPMMLRMFEMMWNEIPFIYNAFLQWIVNHLVRSFKTVECKISLKRTTIADDLDRKQALMSLMSGNQIAPSTALEPYGIDDIRAEIRKVFEHQRILAEEQQKSDEEMQKMQEAGILKQTTALPTPSSQQAGAAPPVDPATGMPMPPSPSQMAQQGSGNMSLGDLEAQAQQIAQQLLPMPYEQRVPELKAIRETNKSLHALVMSSLKQMRQQAQSEGGYQMIASMAGQQPVG
jgi:hypothetical protein